MPRASLPMSILLLNLRPISVLAVLHSISKEQVTHNTTVPLQWPQFQWHHLVVLPPGLQTGHVITIVPAAITRTLNWSNVVTKWIFSFRKYQKKPKHHHSSTPMIPISMTSSGSAAPGPADGSRDHYSASGNYMHAKLVKRGNEMDVFI